MISPQIQLVFFILIVFVLLTLLALNIYLVSRFFSRNKFTEFTKKSPHKNTIQNISHQINLHTQLKNFENTVIGVCPVAAITLERTPEKLLIVSEKRCLGEACLECLRLILLKKIESEK